MAVQVKTYKNSKDFEKDANKRLQQGWELQGQTSSRGKVNMGRTAAKAVTLLPWAVMRPSRKDDKVTATWVR